MIPLSTPGMDNFQITFVKVWNLFAPRSQAASIKDLSILLRDVWIGMIINGIKLQTRPTTTEKSVYIIVTGEIPSNPSKWLMIPLSDSRFIHAQVRRSILIHSGIVTNRIRRLWDFSGHLEIIYASGQPSPRQMTVVRIPSLKDLKITLIYVASRNLRKFSRVKENVSTSFPSSVNAYNAIKISGMTMTTNAHTRYGLIRFLYCFISSFPSYT